MAKEDGVSPSFLHSLRSNFEALTKVKKHTAS